MLINQLRELETDGLLQRKSFADVPPRVEYKVTEYGMTLMPVIAVLQDWGLNDLKSAG